MICNIIIPVLLVSLLAAGYFLWIAFFRDIPYKTDVIEANSAFIAGEYIEVQRILRGYDTTELAFETKYFLSQAYIITEAMTDEQKENVLLGITLRTDPIIFDFWILLGRLRFYEAIDIAQRLGDNEFLLLTYYKYEVVVRNDIAMPGDEKTALLNYIGGVIERLERDRATAADEVAEDEEP